MRQVYRIGIFSTALALAVQFVMPATAAAQSVAQARTWTVNPFLGTSLDISEGAENSLAMGFGVGYDMTPNVGFEGEFSYLFDAAGETDVIDWSITNISGNFVYHFDVRRLTPYATFGLGFERSSLESDDPLLEEIPPTSTELSFNFGGGVKYPLTPRLLVRGDLRRFQANDLAPDYWRLYGGLTFTLGR